MMKNYYRILLGAILLSCIGIACKTGGHNSDDSSAGASRITFGSLLHNLLDREQLAIYPDGLWTQHHASSYDRDSVTDEAAGWVANQDWSNYVRKEMHNGRIEYVLMDVKGPGVITHFWAGGHPNQKSHLRFYMDGQDTAFWVADHVGALIGENKDIGIPLSQRSIDRYNPAVDTLSRLTSAGPNYSGNSSGHNLYAPIPFNKRIKITSDLPHGKVPTGFWYNIDYRLYHGDTGIESFSIKTPKKYAKELKAANRQLNESMALSPKDARSRGEKKIKKKIFSLLPHSSKAIEITEPGSIRRLFLALKSDHSDEAVKNTWLQIEFDGKQTVNCPIGFFFGCGDQLVNARDWYRKVSKNGDMAAFWVMPFHKNAMVRLLNKGNKTVSGTMKVALGSWKWDSNSMYFHTNFKRLDSFSTVRHRILYIPYLNVEDHAGLYVGDMLQVHPYFDRWWGEGDANIYVDGGATPDFIGTGTEDYYGYAWGNPRIFNHIFNGQPISDLKGNRINSRVRSLDAIPFKNSFRFDMESLNNIGGWIDYAVACYWYQRPN